ncbi:hypothetical protein [Methylobacterium frigidaeris]|uniref:Uncharacterized protein n=1 Tax=Methylobacterium frigidaeris TaxID=2038277 RepID=A0AA37HIW3_9HYPH|nr:hypothetical protein [Methylobacterium frigidaeris]PIK68788.1 hypothetical protein CS379_33160 [Methylobacterium frigidaeris]GJD66409.1 hypothetical protein MPEAHAMD_6606 [Methylobacterium frigidaeris]
MFFIMAATISGGLTAVAWTLQYGTGWAIVFGILTATVCGAQAALILAAIERREDPDPGERDRAPAGPAPPAGRAAEAAEVTVPHSPRTEP